MDRDLTGLKFGMLTVIRREKDVVSKSGRVRKKWLCRCDCGNEKVVGEDALVYNHTKSCGCYVIERTRQMGLRNKKHGYHSLDATREQYRLYKAWEAMKSRCNNSKNPQYHNYGSRGIAVCEEWNDDFNNFKEWAESHGYQEGLSIDRIDVNGDYEPNNCRWVDMKVQQNNRRNNVNIEINGETHTATEWTEISGVDVATLLCRYYTGKYSNKDIVFQDDIRNLTSRKITANGKTQTIADWVKDTGLTQATIRGRLALGWSDQDIINTPMIKHKEIEIDGVKHTVYEWAKIVGITPKTIYDRIDRGWSERDSVILPIGSCPDGKTEKHKYYTVEETDMLMRLYHDGVPIKEIATKLGRTKESVRSKIDKLKKRHKIPEDLPFE